MTVVITLVGVAVVVVIAAALLRTLVSLAVTIGIVLVVVGVAWYFVGDALGPYSGEAWEFFLGIYHFGRDALGYGR